MAGTTTQQDFPLSTLGGVSLDDLVKQSVASSPYEARQKDIADKATKVLEEQQSDPKLQKLRDEEKDAAERMAKTAKEKYDEIKPLQVEPWKAKPPENDPLQSFGSIGGAFAMIASAFTHQPMVNALNAGAAAMNAYRANDLRTYEEARRAWKDNMELAIERHKEQSEAFKEAMELGKTDVAARDAALQTYAAKYGDQIAALKTEAGMVGDLDKIWQSRQQNADRLLQLYPGLERESEKRAILLADPDYLSKDPKRMAAAVQRATLATSPYQSSMGDPKRVALNAFIDQYQAAHNGEYPPADAIAKFESSTARSPYRSPQAMATNKFIDDYKEKHNGEEPTAEDISAFAARYGQKVKAAKDFGTGQQGNLVRAQNVAIDHLSTLDTLIDALKNNDVKAVNRVANKIAAETGDPAPTNFELAREIVSKEIAKSIVPGGGGVTERQELARLASVADSPAQLAGYVATAKKLMAGQLNGLRKQYDANGLNDVQPFDTYLLPSTIKELENTKEPSGSGAGDADSGWSVTRLK